ncbi:ABC transporter permease [Parabacteroides sp. OttesenSCG-928-J18]|nr:ABC transporter permease [Parabacteroides sp. OttesenSCG-928-J18]
MLKNIWKQLMNRKRKNLWIALELLLVFCLLWYIVDYFFLLNYNRSIRSYRDMKHTYKLELAEYTANQTEYSEQEDTPDAAIANLRRIVQRLREHPDVESVALAIEASSFPGRDINTGVKYRNQEDNSRVADIQFIRFVPEEDYFQVFRHISGDGKTAVSMNNYDWNDPENILITRMMEKQLFPGQSAIGKMIEVHENRFYPDLRKEYKVIGILDDIKRFDYLRPYSVMFIPERINEINYHSVTIAFRTNGKTPASRFIPAFKKEMNSRLQLGNYYLEDVLYFPKIEKDTEYEYGMTNEIRMRTAMMIFFLVNMTLCLLGTFWYRVNARKEEIGIRRALGADTVSIRRLFIQEGLLLLLLVMVPAMIIEVQFVFMGMTNTLMADIPSYGNYLPDHTFLRFLLTNLITWLILAVMVILAVWYPARSASRITPVDALRDE